MRAADGQRASSPSSAAPDGTVDVAAWSPASDDWLATIVETNRPSKPFDPGRLLGALYLVGAAIALLSAAFPKLGAADRLTLIVSGCAGLALGAALSFVRPPLGDRAVVALTLLGSSWMGALAYSVSSTAGLAALLLFAPAAFAITSFLPALVGAVYAASLPGILLGATGALGSSSLAPTAYRQWIVIGAAIAVSSALVNRLSRRARQGEVALSSITSELDVGIALIGAGRRYVAVNPVLCRMLGRSREEIVGNLVGDFNVAEDRERPLGTDGALLDTSLASSSHEARLVRSDGEVVYAMVTSASIRPAPGDPLLTIELVQDVTELRRIGEQRSELAQLLMSAQEDERRRIADEVHDDPLQSLIALSIQLQVLDNLGIGPEAAAAAGDIKKSVAQAIDQMRSLLFELHPPALHLGGLSESLREFVHRYEESGGPKVDLDITIAREPGPEEAVVLFRITTEALTNARKHADARNVSVGVADSQGGIALTVGDDGVGFEHDATSRTPGHLGVVSMRERAERAGGSFDISSKPGTGATVRAWIPRARS